eukprot:COSAG05_NODE_16459_length_345_cov_1.459350_1_plen_78_part_01
MSRQERRAGLSRKTHRQLLIPALPIPPGPQDSEALRRRGEQVLEGAPSPDVPPPHVDRIGLETPGHLQIRPSTVIYDP